MTAHENAAIIRRAYDEAVNRSEFAVLYERFAADMVNHGRDPSIEALVADGDLVATREVWSGTHVRRGEQIRGTVLHFFRFDRGLVVEEWSGGWEWIARQEIIPAGHVSGPADEEQARIQPI